MLMEMPSHFIFIKDPPSPVVYILSLCYRRASWCVCLCLYVRTHIALVNNGYFLWEKEKLSPCEVLGRPNSIYSCAFTHIVTTASLLLSFSLSLSLFVSLFCSLFLSPSLSLCFSLVFCSLAISFSAPLSLSL